ncbi:hypothetical protein DL96DRAFT_1612264 [Flagelloscypha sp. PMI_526]|nr:hypothetical protein DL96DRAFT_1612264 [Flagelloscypha sp. PMI_526]
MSSIVLQLADALKKAGLQLAAQETKSSADLSKAERERDELRRDRDDLRRQLDDLRKQRDVDVDDLRHQRDAATKHSHELLLEKESWKQDSKSSKASLEQTLLNFQRLEDQYQHLKEELIQAKEDNMRFKDQIEKWQKEFLRVDRDNRTWQELYVHAEQRIEEQLSLANAVDSSPISHHQTQLTDSASTPRRHRPSTHKPLRSPEMSSAHAKATIHTSDHHTNRSLAQARHTIESPSLAHRSKRQRLDRSGSPPFRATSSILIRRVKSQEVPCTINLLLLLAVASPSHRRKRRVPSESEAESEDDLLRPLTRFLPLNKKTGLDVDSDDELTIGPPRQVVVAGRKSQSSRSKPPR